MTARCIKCGWCFVNFARIDACIECGGDVEPVEEEPAVAAGWSDDSVDPAAPEGSDS